MKPPAIRIQGLSQGYDRQAVVVDLNLEVEAGEIFGFIGPNGAGKTTTIRTLATLMPPLAGRVEICGLDVEVSPEQVRKVIGYMPDHAGVYERLTTAEYLDFFAHAAGVPSERVTPAVMELLDLSSLADTLVATLSKGMRQRLQLARVLLHDPQVLILDEPASDLDPRARIEMRDVLLELRDLGKTVFLSSHILSELSDVCTSVGIIEKGRLVLSCPVGELGSALGPSSPAVPWEPLPLDGSATSTAPSFDVTPELTPAGVAVPTSSQRRLKLRLLQDARSIRPLLQACPPIKEIESERGHLVVARYVGDERFVADLVRYLVSHGVGIVGVEAERNDLERVFLQVTQGELQ